MHPTVLIIDDDPDVQGLVQLALQQEGVVLTPAYTAAKALEELDREMFAAVVLDLGLPDTPGDELLATIRERHPDVPVLVLSGERELDRVVRCMKLGALDYIPKPFEALRLQTSVRNAIEQGALRVRVEALTHDQTTTRGFSTLLGNSPAMQQAVSLLARSAGRDVTVLLTGESGTGKEVAARAVHSESARASGPFIAINCGAIPEGIIESELFGHERGAFTGADSARRGVFEEADGGTLFLDEIGELRADLQVRLLRVLQERQVQRVGASTTRDVDVRIIAATNRDLPERVASGAFRADLYYRLAVFPVELPPLRERGDDVLVLAKAFLQRIAAEQGQLLESWTRAAASALLAHSWPGNVRELQNVMERAVILEDSGNLTLASLPEPIRRLATDCGDDHVELPLATASGDGEGAAASPPPPVVIGRTAPRTPDEIESFDAQEQRIFEEALTACGWNIHDASRRLAVGRATVYRKIEKYGLDRRDELEGRTSA
ncbi:MAG: sigma-54-dependent transcriptional regulator [Planctomycetota bacterium]